MSIASNFPAIKPSLNLDFANTKMLDSRVTFTRASTGTYYNGVTTALAEQNLFTYSQEFDNAAWSKARTTVTANATTAPDGTATADAILETVDTNTHYVNQSFIPTGQAVTISVFAKSGLGRDWIWIRTINSTPAERTAFFDVTTGVVGTVGAGLTASIQSVGSGWYRCVVSTTDSNTSIDAWGFGPASANGTNNYAGDVTKGVYLWGAQLEKRSVVTAYTVTTTQAITNYIPVLLTAQSGVPRFDHNPTTDESLGLLIEESRTNLLTYSSDFSQSGTWPLTGGTTINYATAVAPDGTLTATKLIRPSGSSSNSYINHTVVTFTAPFTQSVYAKAGGMNWLFMQASGSGSNAYFDLANGAVGSTTDCTASVTSVGNGWYRCSLTDTSGTSSAMVLWATTGNGVTTVTGDGYSGIYIWGTQLEAGSFATSYIPTTSAAVTRAADAASMTGTNFSSWYNAGEGTLFTEAQTLSVGSASRVICEISNGTTSNRSQQSINTSGSLVLFVNSGGVTSANSIASGSTSSNTNFKIVSAYKVNDFATVGNAQAAATSTSGNTALDQNTLKIGARFDDTLRINGTIKKIAYYPMRVTNAQLQALTS